MNLWFEHNGRRFYRLAVRTPQDFATPTAGRPYAGLFWSHTPFREPDRWALANAIVDSGCRYAVCAGAENEALHDDIDSAYIRPIVELRPEGIGRELVMTTWHDAEPPDEVAFFLTHSVFREDGGAFDEFLVVHLNGTPDEHAIVDRAVRQQAFDDPLPNERCS
jgi:hypothetical protein